MKKIIRGLLCILILVVIPIHMSNTSETKLSENEVRVLDKMIRVALINHEIAKEYREFYTNLDTIKISQRAIDFIGMLTCDAIQSKSLPSIVIAQASLETGYGKYNKLKNNLFGIKGRGIITKTKEYYRGRFITIRAEFQYFRTVKDAFDKHHQILNRYGVFGHDYNTWIDRIVMCGYATDPNYDMKLNYIIDKFQLQKLDKIQELNSKYLKIGEEKCNLTPIFTYSTKQNVEEIKNNEVY